MVCEKKKRSLCLLVVGWTPRGASGRLKVVAGFHGEGISDCTGVLKRPWRMWDELRALYLQEAGHKSPEHNVGMKMAWIQRVREVHTLGTGGGQC